MNKINLGDIEFIIHNKREALFVRDLERDIETLRDYISNPTKALAEYDTASIISIIDFRLSSLHGKLSACFWMDITKNSYGIYSADDFKRHFMNA